MAPRGVPMAIFGVILLVTSSVDGGFTAAGGLLSYEGDFLRGWRVAARYVDRILTGAKPADLPVEQLTTCDLVINLKTAKTLGLTIPPAVLARADEIIHPMTGGPRHPTRRYEHRCRDRATASGREG